MSQFRVPFSGQAEIDFGALPVAEKSFSIPDDRVKASSRVTGALAYTAPTGKQLDELEMDAVELRFGAVDGAVLCYARGMEGYLADKFLINYLVS